VPSTHDEGFPRVIVEAISCGTPVVASNKGSIPEAMDDTIGIVCEPELAVFVKQIGFLLRNREILNSLSGRCREYALLRYSEENAFEIEGAYDTAMRCDLALSTNPKQTTSLLSTVHAKGPIDSIARGRRILNGRRK
jgi:hypothetical protein